MAYDETAIREAMKTAIAAGVHAGNPIRVVCEGDQKVIGDGVVALMPPIPMIGADGEGPSEAWVCSASVWTMNLYVALSARSSAERAHAALGSLTWATLDALHDGRELGGLAHGMRPAIDPSEARQTTIGERKFLTRELGVFVFHR